MVRANKSRNPDTGYVDFFNRFTFGHGLLNGCLPADFYMIDLKDKSVSSGNIIAFHMPKSVRFIRENEKVIKIVAGVGGDRLRVTLMVFIMGTNFIKPMPDVFL